MSLLHLTVHLATAMPQAKTGE